VLAPGHGRVIGATAAAAAMTHLAQCFDDIARPRPARASQAAFL
jgi:hypothetical protein